MRAENVTGPVAHHGEGPVWSPSWGGLRFVDLTAGELLTLEGDDVRRLAVGSPIAAFHRPRTSGGYVVATERGLALSDTADGRPVHALDLVTTDGVRMNDGGTDPLGRLYGGSMAYDEGVGRGSLYRIDAELRVRVVLPNVTISNGIGFSPDGQRCYYIDTPTGRIDVFDAVAGELSDRRPFVTIDESIGYPDGLTVAADGSIWVALWAGGAVRGYSAEGEHIATIEVAAKQVTACTFGGDDLTTLYITTSRQGLSADADPEAGSLFAVRPGATGLAVISFAG